MSPAGPYAMRALPLACERVRRGVCDPRQRSFALTTRIAAAAATSVAETIMIRRGRRALSSTFRVSTKCRRHSAQLARCSSALDLSILERPRSRYAASSRSVMCPSAFVGGVISYFRGGGRSVSKRQQSFFAFCYTDDQTLFALTLSFGALDAARLQGDAESRQNRIQLTIDAELGRRTDDCGDAGGRETVIETESQQQAFLSGELL